MSPLNKSVSIELARYSHIDNHKDQSIFPIKSINPDQRSILREKTTAIDVIDYAQYTIHVVDDSRTVVVMLTDLLQEQGYDVISTTNGKEALEQIDLNSPDLIILDVEMPVMDGYETMKRLKASSQTSNIPVIFHTTLTKAEVIKKLFELGASDYISKPFVPEELLARIEKEIKAINLQKLLKEKMSKLAEALSTDPLTRLHNKMHMISVINSKLKRLKAEKRGVFSLVYIDIDRFNDFTKVHGIIPAESAIKKVAMILKRTIRDKDTLAHWNGDVFMILCPQIVKEELDTMAKKIRDHIGKAPFSGTNLTSTIAMIEVSTTDGIDKGILLSRLESKIKEAKALSKELIISIDGKHLT